MVRCGVDTVFEARWRRTDGTCSGGACKREGGIASRISWSWETDDGFRKGSSLECMNAGSTGDGGDVLWEPFLAGDGSPREENPLLSELSVDVRASGDVKRREMPRERSIWSFRVDCREVLFRNHGVSANITMRDLDLGATVHDVWRLGSVANGLLLFRGIRGRRRHHCSCPHCTRRVATQTCSRQGPSCARWSSTKSPPNSIGGSFDCPVLRRWHAPNHQVSSAKQSNCGGLGGVPSSLELRSPRLREFLLDVHRVMMSTAKHH